MTDNDTSRRKSFDTKSEALDWIKDNKPYYWRLDFHTQVYVTEGGPGAPLMDVSV